MSTRAALLSSLLFALLVLSPLAEAAPATCVNFAPMIGGAPVPGPYWQVNALTAYAFAGVCGGQWEAAGAAAACPPAPFIGAVPGAFCGPAIPWFGSTTCTWFRGTHLLSWQLTMIVGYDLNGDGMIGPLDLAYDGWAAETTGLGADTFPNTNVFGAGGRLIVYPATWFTFPEPAATAWINCA